MDLIRRHPVIATVAALVAVVGIVVVVVVFEPQALYIDDRVDEPLPSGASGSERTADPSPSDEWVTSPAPVASPQTLSTGAFRSLEHAAHGNALLVRLADGSLIVRFEQFEVENGPDLRVYLSTAQPDGPPSALDDDFLDLGGLKGNIGDQNYVIPDGTDLARYRSVSVWCRRFSVGFAVAPVDGAAA